MEPGMEGEGDRKGKGAGGGGGGGAAEAEEDSPRSKQASTRKLFFLLPRSMCLLGRVHASFLSVTRICFPNAPPPSPPCLPTPPPPPRPSPSTSPWQSGVVNSFWGVV